HSYSYDLFLYHCFIFFLMTLRPSISTLFPYTTLFRSINKWQWLNHHLKKADSISIKYGKFGLYSLIFLVPFIGVYVGVAVGVALRLRPILILISLSIGVFLSGFLTTFLGNEILNLF